MEKRMLKNYVELYGFKIFKGSYAVNNLDDEKKMEFADSVIIVDGEGKWLALISEDRVAWMKLYSRFHFLPSDVRKSILLFVSEYALTDLENR